MRIPAGVPIRTRRLLYLLYALIFPLANIDKGVFPRHPLVTVRYHGKPD